MNQRFQEESIFNNFSHSSKQKGKQRSTSQDLQNRADTTQYPLSPPESEYGWSPSPFARAPTSTYQPLSPPESEHDFHFTPSTPASTIYYPLSPPESEKSLPPTSPASTTQTFQIFARDIGGRTVTLDDITQSTMLREVKKKYEEKEGVPIYEQRFIFEGKELDDGRAVSYYNICAGNTLHLVFRLKGGED